MKPFLFALFFTTSLFVTVHADTPGEVKIGSYLREATLHGFDGSRKKISSYKGKPLIINIWASWCGPCREEMGSLERLGRLYNGKAFNLIGISTDDDYKAAEDFIKKSGVTFENFHDYRLLFENMLGANTIPLTVLVDANGRIVEKVRGAYKWDIPSTVSAIEKVLRVKLDATRK